MKTAEQYYEDFAIKINEIFRPNVDHQRKLTIEVIKQAQQDAIDLAVKECAESAKAVFSKTFGVVLVDKQSILQVAERLKKEIQ